MKRRAITFSILSFIVLVLAAASLLCGAERVSLAAALRGDALARVILLHLRLPRTLLALAAGTMLGSAGAVSQLYFRNPIAEPGIMGLSAGAALGAVIIATAFSTMPYFAVNAASFAGALGTGIVLLAILGARRTTPAALLLCGAALGTLASAVTSVLLLSRQDALRTMYVWALGSMSGRGWLELRFIALPALLSVLMFCRIAPSLDLMAGGEETAASLGVAVKHLRAAVLVALSLAVSSAVCAGGTIGFVGLIAPHIARRITSSRASVLLPAAAMSGAALLLASDIAARMVFRPAELPVGVVTSLIGAPFFILLMVRQSRQEVI